LSISLQREGSMQTKDWLVPALTIAASFLGAWLAAHFALASFYRERIWERKAATYSAIFEALSVINRWYDKTTMLSSSIENCLPKQK
jgi:hypothetical protein